MRSYPTWVWLLPLATMISPAASSSAAQELTVLSDQTSLIPLPKAPGTIVVGNPSVANVVLSGQKLLILGVAFGRTNIIALDAEGSKIAEYVVNVTQQDPNTVQLFTPGGRKSFNCVTDCEATVQIGDAAEFSAATADAAKSRSSLAESAARGN